MAALASGSPPCRSSTLQRPRPVSSGLKVQACYPAVAEFPDGGVAVEGDFVEAACAVNHEAALGAEETKDLGHLLAELGEGDAD